MSMLAWTELLAQLPESTTYVHLGKLLAALLLAGLWAVWAQWVDKDTIAVNTFRQVWNLVMIGTGVVSLAALFFIPNFLAAALVFLVIQIAAGASYVIHRNGLVQEDSKVFTPAHIQRLLSEGMGGAARKKKLAEVRERVVLVGANRKRVAIPDDELERDQYRLTQDLLYNALFARASLIDLTPAGQAFRVTQQVDGLSAEREPLARTDGESVLFYLKKLAGMNVEERRKPQRGKLSVAIGDHKFDAMLRSHGSTAGERLTIRLVGDEKRFKVPDLGFTAPQLDAMQRILQAKTGLVLVTSTPGNGLTTTIYSITRSHDAFLQNIQMLEYERELDIENVTQRTHEPTPEFTFADDVLKITRADPDVVVLPEVRDRNTAVTAAQAAAAKVKFFIGLHATDVLDALRKWLALVGDPKIVGRGQLAVINQRLIRKLCNACKAAYKPDPGMLRKINMPPDRVLHRPPEPQYDKHGNPIICQGCGGTGYVGRTAVFTILEVDDGLRQILVSGGAVNEIQAYLSKVPGLNLQQQALQKVFDGVTSIEEVVRVTRPAQPAAGASPATPKEPTSV